MKSYINGYYSASPIMLETLKNEIRRGIIDGLLNEYPKSKTVKEIASETHLNIKTIYGEQYLAKLKLYGIVREVEDSEETGGGRESRRYIIENVNSLSRDSVNNPSNDRDMKYSLSPGNVEYSKEFKQALDWLVHQAQNENIFKTLSGFVRSIVERVEESDDERARKIRPKKDTDYICSSCGLNHEARDFIRATLLYLLDQFETSPYYVGFLYEQKYLDQEHYKQYYQIIGEKSGT